MITLSRYTPRDAALWDAAVAACRNATFMHRRAYLDYHADRFPDHSLMAYDDSGRLVALLPATVKDAMLVSHAGLTYGGWLMQRDRCDAAVMLDVIDATRRYVAAAGLTAYIVKPVPHIYHSAPAEEEVYALYRHGAVMTAVGVSAAIDLADAIPFDAGNRRNVKEALKAGLTVERDNDFAAFWPLLTDVLASRHDVAPVHILDEILLLHSRFPEEISLTTVRREGRVIAGVVMFDTPRVAHAQYIASGDEGRRTKALALLFDRLIRDAAARGQRFFDFGVSTERGGAVLNEGLMRQKNRLGGRAVVYPQFTLSV